MEIAKKVISASYNSSETTFIPCKLPIFELRKPRNYVHTLHPTHDEDVGGGGDEHQAVECFSEAYTHTHKN